MVRGMLTDQQLVVHAFAPAEGPRAAEAYGQLRAVWARCRELLGVTVPIPGLPSALPAEVPTAGGQSVLAALEDLAAARQTIIRRHHDVINLSMVFTAPQETSERRRLIGSASPPGWVEFDRWWDELAEEGTGALLGLTRLYLAEHAGDGPPLHAVERVRATVPRVDESRLWWEHGELRLDEFAVWELTPDEPAGAERRIGIVAPAGRDSPLSVWTWSNGGPDLPPLARYLMHAAKVRYETRVWDGGRAVDQLRRRVDLAVDQLRRALGTGQLPAAAHRLMGEELNLATALQDVWDMRHTVEIAMENMANALPVPLRSDLAQGRWLIQALTDAAQYLAASQHTAAQVQQVAQRGAPPRTAAAEPATVRRAGVAVRVGFAVDVVGYSARTAVAKDDAQRRVADMLGEVLATLRIGIEETDRQDAGDATKVFLPADVELHRALPALLAGWREQLARDNRRYRDPLRLRLAVGVGPVGLAALGFGGNTIVEVSRLLDSDVLRQAAARHPETKLVALISNELHKWVVSEGHDGLDPARFARVEVRVKDFADVAWLWVAD